VKYVLDTNIVTRLLSGDERVLAHLVEVDPSDVGIPLLVATLVTHDAALQDGAIEGLVVEDWFSVP
jgi:predicted nucleic acid-binding protein